jgi:hypothetical protein
VLSECKALKAISATSDPKESEEIEDIPVHLDVSVFPDWTDTPARRENKDPRAVTARMVYLDVLEYPVYQVFAVLMAKLDVPA